MRVSAVLFDLDGTLVDSLPGIEYASRSAFQSVLPGRALPDLHDLVGPPIRGIFRQAIPDSTPELLDELESHFRVAYDTVGWQKSVAYDGVVPTLARLSELGLQSFVVTNKPRVPTQRIAQHLGVDDYFTEVVTPDSKTPPFKSKAEAASYLLAKYSLDPSRTLFVGDSDDDVRAAQSCGVMFVAAAYGYGNVHIECEWRKEYILDKISDLLEIVTAQMSSVGEFAKAKPSIKENPS